MGKVNRNINSNSINMFLGEVKNGKLTTDNIAKLGGYKNIAEMNRYKKDNPNLYAVMDGIKYEPQVASKNYTPLTTEEKKIVDKAIEQDKYYKKYGVLDFAKNYNVDIDRLNDEIAALDADVNKIKEIIQPELYKENLFVNEIEDTRGKKKVIVRDNKARQRYNSALEILNKYDCKSVNELDGILATKERSKNFWEQSHKLVEMSEVGDTSSDNYDPEFYEWVKIGKNLQSQNIMGEQLAPHQALNSVETVRKMYKEYIGNVEGLSQKIATNLADDSMAQIAAILQMTDKQVDLYNYYLAKEYYNEVKSGTAERYLEYLKTQYNANTAEIIQKELKNNPFFQYAYSAHAGKQRFEDNMKTLGDLFGKDVYRAETTSQKASEKIRQDVIERDGVLGKIGYDLIDTAAYQLPSILASTVSNVVIPGSGAIVGAGLNGVSAMSGAYNEAKRLGFDEKQARIYSAGIGASEAALSYTIGGISKLGGKLTGSVIDKAINGIDNGIAKFALQYGGRILSESAEEGIQEILNPIFKSMATKTNVEYWGGIDWEDVVYSALLGGLTSGVFELSESISTNIKDNKLNSNEVIDGMWEDAPNTSKYNVENAKENGIIEETRKVTLDDLTKDILKTKPPNARIPSNWIKEGGSIEIDKYGNWIYIDKFGIRVKYINGYPYYRGAGIVFQTVNIGRFANRSIDKRLADKLAPNGPCKEGHVWHHSEDGYTMEEVDGEIHRRFTHKGGISLLKGRKKYGI